MLEFQPKEFGDYVLQDRIGAGGMAEIFLATSKGIEGFEKRLVIKRILPSLSDDEQFVRMFIEEAKLCVALRHPNIVQVYDLGVIDYQYYIAMEYVDGRDLLKTLAACGKNKIGFPTDIALHIVMESLKGLEYAHNLERPDGEPLCIIHRDVSPSNLLLSFEGEIKIGDFGIAKASTREKTATGILKGKFGYMAPEQVTGAAIDHRADVFAMGIVLYELLTGHRLFAGKNDLLVLEQVRDAVIDPPPRHYRPDLDAELEGIVLRALARRPEERFQSAGDLHDAIHNYVYRSRALVGPAHLGRFMQSLFLAQPEEIARRSRARLPPVPSLEDLSTGFGDESTQQEQGSAGHMAARSDAPNAMHPAGQDSLSALSEVIVSEEYEWGALADDSEATRNEFYPVTPQPLNREHQEVTIQTDVGIEVSDSDVEAIASGSQVSTRAPNPKAEVMALRQARAQDDPTAFDLQDEPGYNVVEPEATRDDMAAADRNVSIATALHDEISDAEDETRDGSIEPAAIVERTRVTAEPEPAEDDQDVEPTVQFDSTVYPALRADTPLPEASPPLPKIDLLDGVSAANFSEEYREKDAHSEFGTMQLEGADIPTAEVSDMEFDSITVGPEEGTEIAFAPVPSPDPTEPLPAAQSEIGFDEVHEEEDETLLRDDVNGELAALIAKNSPAVQAIEHIEDEADRTDLFDPVQEGMIAELAAQTAGAPSRRRPLTGRRARPVLLPAEGEAARIDPRPSSQAHFGRRRSSLRRRVATRIPLSVVNPGATPENNGHQQMPIQPRAIPQDRAVSTRPTPVPGARDHSIARANTGAGSLVDVQAYNDEAHHEDPANQPAPRNASGITAALSEAALIDDEIAELRKPSVKPRDVTDAGPLAEIGPDEDSTHGADLRSAIINRKARRRMVTQSVILYGDDTEEPTRGDSVSFAEDSELSVPALSDAGQLDDEGASELFGVLSVLDEDPADFGFEADNELSLETDARFYADFSDSISHVQTETPPERKSSEQAMAEAYGNTSFGSLAEAADNTGPGPMLEFGNDEDEPTASVTDGQVLSVSQLDLQVDPDILTPGSSSMRAFDLEFSDDAPVLERGLTGAVDPSSRGDSLLVLDPAGEQFSEFEEPTQEESMDAATGLGSFRPNSLGLELTSDERPSDQGGGSDSFDFGDAQQGRWRNAYDEPPAQSPAPDLPVRPVTMQGPSDGIEATASQMASPEDLDLKSRSNQNVLRAVVERQRVAKELNRGSITPPASQPSPQPFASGPVSAASMGSVGALPAAGAVPPLYTPSKPNKILYAVVGIAIAVSVAAGVSTWLLHDPAPLVPAQDSLREGLVEVPELPAPDSTPKPPITEIPTPTPDSAKEAPAVDAKKVAALPAETVDAPAEPATEKKVVPKKRRKRSTKRARRRAAKRPRRKVPKVDGSKSILRMSCEQPIDIRISTVGTRRNQTRFKESLKPGWYRVKLSRNGDKLDQLDVNLLPGQSLTLPCP